MAKGSISYIRKSVSCTHGITRRQTRVLIDGYTILWDSPGASIVKWARTTKTVQFTQDGGGDNQLDSKLDVAVSEGLTRTGPKFMSTQSRRRNEVAGRRTTNQAGANSELCNHADAQFSRKSMASHNKPRMNG